LENGRELIVMVDDDITNLNVARNNLVGKYNILTAPSGEKLFALLEKVTPDLILLDIEMPEMDGYKVIKKLKGVSKTSRIPIIFLTAKIDPENEVKGLNLGAVDYITKPFSRELLLKRIDLHLLVEKQKKELMKYNLDLQGEVGKQTSTVFELQNAILKTVAELVERRDSVTGGHIERTQNYLSMLVKYLLEHDVYIEELSSWDISLFIMSSQLHDVGKISIKDNILMKPGPLDKEEFEEMKKHTTFGVDIIKSIEQNTTENEFLNYAEVLAGSHHEKWDGTGYPYGLKGLEIPLQGRLMALVDVYDALTNDRPYKKAYSHEEALEIIKDGIGKHFDPSIIEVFVAHSGEFKAAAAGKNHSRDLYDRLNPVEKLGPTMQVIANIMDIRSGVESGHAEKLKSYLEILISTLMKHGDYSAEVSSWDIDNFLMSAQLHDLGKIAVADQILNKKGKLTEEEYNDIKNHADYGKKIIKQIQENANYSGLLQHAESIAGFHHEKWDGTGYPAGLKGEDIPLQGRLMAIIDVYDALTSDRPQRKRLPHHEAVEIIMNGSGSHFDPDLVTVFLECEKEFEGMLNS